MDNVSSESVLIRNIHHHLDIKEEQAYRNFFTTAPIMMGIADIVGNDIRHVMDNPATEIFFEVEHDSMNGKLASELGVPEEALQLWLDKYREAEREKRHITFDYIHTDKKGDVYFLSATVSYLGKNQLNESRFSYVVHDVTELQKSKHVLEEKVQMRTEELRNSAKQLARELAQLEAVIQAVNDGIMVFNMKGDIVLLNSAAIKSSGHSTELSAKNELKNYKELFTLKDLNGQVLQKAQWPISRVLRGETIRDLELIVSQKNGEEVVLSFSAQPVRDWEGSQILGVVVTRNITDKKKFEAELERTNNILNAVMTTSEDVIYVKDLHSRMIYANQSALKLIGKKLRDIIGKNDSAFLEKKLAEQILKNDKQVMESGRTIMFEEKVNSKIYMSSKSPYRDNNGKIIGLIGVSRDITNRKAEEDRLLNISDRLAASQRKFSTIFERAPFAVALVKLPEIKIVDVNPAWVEMIGCSKEDAIGKTSDEIGVQYYEEDLKKIFELFEREGRVKGFETTIINKHLKIVRIAEYMDSLEIEGEKYMMASMEDITERWHATQELESALRVRDEFLSVASHELKTPLSSLTLQTQLFLLKASRGDSDVFKEDKVLKLVSQTEKQMKRLTRLVDDMLDISRIRTGRLTIHKEKFDMCHLVCNVIEQLKPQAKAEDVQIKYNPCHAIVGEWDLFRMEQVILNLLTNAIRYGKNRPIDVSTTIIDSKVLLSVKDQGMGISNEDMERIFNRFERAISKNEVPGLGLGLYISNQIVKAHNGRIWVESELGKGATFFVELPLK